jgi:hypothetical protein
LYRSSDAIPETTGSLSRPGRTVAARPEQSALSLFPMSLMEAIDKPDGGQRLLGVPNAIERLIQQS